jgi:hypothetical protein
MAFQDRFEKISCFFFYSSYLIVIQNKKGRQKRSGSKKTNGIYHQKDNDSKEREREREDNQTGKET